MKTKFTLTQEEAFKVYTNQKIDVVKSTYQDIVIFRATNKNDKASLVIFKGRSAKPIANYYYSTYEQREESIRNYKNAADARIEYKETKKAEKKAAGAPESKVGTIFSDSWGYEQTNVDFYIITERPSAHFAMVQEIGAKRVEGSEGHDCCRLMPDSDNRIGESFKVKLVKKYNSEYFRISSSRQPSIWDGESEYCSWYH